MHCDGSPNQRGYQTDLQTRTQEFNSHINTENFSKTGNNWTASLLYKQKVKKKVMKELVLGVSIKAHDTDHVYRS